MAKGAVSGTMAGLKSFFFKPDGLIGESIFRHMVQKHLFDPKVTENHPSSYLNIELNSNQVGELGPSAKDLTNQRILIFAGGHGETVKLVKLKIDSLVNINSISGVQNDPDHLG
jgi:hypothetical protein